MSKESNRWKGAERQVSDIYNKYKVPATRITRAGNYAISTYDVEIEGHPEIKSDSKYSIRGFKTNRMLDVVEAKYCKEEGDIPVLFTKGYKERGMKATCDAELFAKMLSYWLGLATKEELDGIK